MLNLKVLNVCSLFFIYSLIYIVSCDGQDKTILSNGNESTKQLLKLPFSQDLKPDPALQIGEYVREVFQDKNGNLWFGTLAYGIARFDGESLVYFSKKEGLIGNQINGIAEDKDGNLWLATTEGVSKYDGKSFTNFSVEDGLSDNSAWSILADRAGNIWVGTMGGVCRYNGSSFSSFPIPKANVENPTSIFNTNLVWSIIEDRQGNIWFGTDGVGVCKYDGKSFIHFTKEDGLNTNDVIAILEDSKGNLWFGSRETRVQENKEKDPYKYVDSGDGGLSRYDGNSFQQFTEIEGLIGKVIGPIYEDKNGDIWIASMHYGAFRYDGKQFTNFKEEQGIAPYNCIQSILEDKDGKLWFGFSGGLFRFDGMSFINVTKDGPWK
jgi:ligand-binding sensor domain-containing protein